MCAKLSRIAAILFGRPHGCSDGIIQDLCTHLTCRQKREHRSGCRRQLKPRCHGLLPPSFCVGLSAFVGCINLGPNERAPPQPLSAHSALTLTGSLPVVKTMGMVLVAALAGIAEMVFATITATGRRTKSRTPAIDHDDLLLSEIPSFVAARAAGSHPDIASVLQQGRKSTNICVSFRESSGEIPVQTARPFGPR